LRCRHSSSCGRMSVCSFAKVPGVRSSLVARPGLSASPWYASRLQPARPAATIAAPAFNLVTRMGFIAPLVMMPDEPIELLSRHGERPFDMLVRCHGSLLRGANSGQVGGWAASGGWGREVAQPSLNVTGRPAQCKKNPGRSSTGEG